MICDRCEQEPCTCEKALAVQDKKPLWLIQYCSIPSCETAIRVPIEQPLSRPVCKWCEQGRSHASRANPWPTGMPNPELPWPWMREEEREKKLRMPYWKERLRKYGDLYQAWLRT